MKEYRVVSGTMFVKPDPEAEALRKNPYWVPFHREAGKRGLYFDNIRQGGAVAFTVTKTPQGGWLSHHLADGKGKTSLLALEDAYRKSGRCDAELDRLLDQLCGRVSEGEDEFDALFA